MAALTASKARVMPEKTNYKSTPFDPGIFLLCENDPAQPLGYLGKSLKIKAFCILLINLKMDLWYATSAANG